MFSTLAMLVNAVSKLTSKIWNAFHFSSKLHSSLTISIAYSISKYIDNSHFILHKFPTIIKLTKLLKVSGVPASHAVTLTARLHSDPSGHRTDMAESTEKIFTSLIPRSE